MSHLCLVSVVGEEAVLKDEPALLVAFDVVRPFVQPALQNLLAFKCTTYNAEKKREGLKLLIRVKMGGGGTKFIL